MPPLSPKHREIQTQNYWEACAWLADKDTPPTKRDHAVAILKALANCPNFEDVSTLAAQALENNNIFQTPEPSLWQGSRP